MRQPLLPVKRQSFRKWSHLTKAGLALVLVAVLTYASLTRTPVAPPRDKLEGSFVIANDRFVKDGVPMQIISGR